MTTWLTYALLPAELVLAVCLVAGVRIPPAVLAVAETAVVVLLLTQGLAYLRLRRRGLGAREAVRVLVPEPARRLVGHELRLMASLGRWTARRPDLGGPGATAFPHARDQAALMYGFAFVCVVETVGVSYLLAEWPAVHAVMLVLDVYTVLFVLGLHAASATRPHLLTADALRVRQAAHVDVTIPLDRITAVRRETLFSHEKKDGELNLAVGSQTSLTLELGEPVDAPRLLGAPRPVRLVRLHADDARALHRALTGASLPTPGRTVPSPVPGPPGSA
ncbi:hypothetical protein [Streptomyces roseicoloratus]|uniref:Integral membrane protein n=1 Tax=Streptomyces roseicoloratus TaxID=2508722 RepID=A0ABY9S047_9ACTN|nr:hypothetical protein [Streptomyces roseicoloratus]WMX47348.1 hypothetical protein RGF97_24480 [Streptomyces roseicoloratus]